MHRASHYKKVVLPSGGTALFYDCGAFHRYFLTCYRKKLTGGRKALIKVRQIRYTILTGGDGVKVRIETAEGLDEDEVIIRCARIDETIQKIHRCILEETAQKTKIVFYKQNQEFYFPLDQVLFFETEEEHIYAHTAKDAYRIKYRLYELEQILPRNFVRASKSTIVNIMQVYSITRNLTASSLVQFVNSHKEIYVSRYYYQELRRCLNERSTYEK